VKTQRNVTLQGEMKWNIYWDLYTEAVSAQHQVIADHSSNITISASTLQGASHLSRISTTPPPRSDNTTSPLPSTVLWSSPGSPRKRNPPNPSSLHNLCS
jgi:hypothetical protein